MNLRLIHIAHLGGIRPLTTKVLRGKEMADFPTIDDAFLTITDGKISDFGPMSECPSDELDTYDCTDRCVLPAFVDSHSHLVYAGTREQEFNLRLKGASYEEIAAAGGGILNSAKKVGATPLGDIVTQSAERLDRLIHYGTGTLEVKSGYGLDAEGELKLLRAVAALNAKTDATLVPTFLAAHALPVWAKERNWNDEQYTRWMLEELMPTVAKEGLAVFLDAFIERDYFKMGTLEAILEASATYNMPTKLHVNQFYDIGAIPRAVEAGALSVDHLEVMSEGAFKALEGSDTIATLLPSCSYFIGIPYAPARRLIDSDTLVALATDYNPGSSPTGNMQLVMNMACAKMKMTPAEALNAATLNGAAALQLSDQKGSITVGKDADLLITRRIPSIEYIAYDFGTNHIEHTLLGGTFQ
jgi:imidazolonepropionase